MIFRDRIKELRRVKASSLIPNPLNPRTHPQAQRDALRGVLEEIGYAGAALARETPEGLMLIDGHLRAETSPDQDVPVLVLDVTEAEAKTLLATFDPISAMAGRDDAKMAELLAGIEAQTPELQKMLADLAGEKLPLAPVVPDEPPPLSEAALLQKKWQTAAGQLWEIPSKTAPPRRVAICPHCHHKNPV